MLARLLLHGVPIVLLSWARGSAVERTTCRLQCCIPRFSKHADFLNWPDCYCTLPKTINEQELHGVEINYQTVKSVKSRQLLEIECLVL